MSLIDPDGVAILGGVHGILDGLIVCAARVVHGDGGGGGGGGGEKKDEGEKEGENCDDEK